MGSSATNMMKLVRQQLRKLGTRRRRCVSEVPMKRALGVGLFAAVVAGFSGAAMLGWAYEGPRRFFRRVKLRKALR